MPYYIEGNFYYTQVELRNTLNRLLETCWMYSHCRSEEERKFLTDSITANFKMDHPEFETRTEVDDFVMQSDHQEYMAEEEIRRQKNVTKETGLAHLRAIVSRGYHVNFYEKFSKFMDKCKAGIGYREFTKIGENTLYFNPQSFVEIPKDLLYRPVNGDIITIRDGGIQPIFVVIRNTPILQLYNLEHSTENTNHEYIYGIVLNAPEGVPYPKDSRIILQIKHVCSIEDKISIQAEENCEFNPILR